MVGFPPRIPATDDPQEIIAEAFAHACQHGRTEVVRWFLDLGVRPGVAPYLGRTGLHWAIPYGHLEVIRLLLERGADPCSPISWSTTRPGSRCWPRPSSDGTTPPSASPGAPSCWRCWPASSSRSVLDSILMFTGLLSGQAGYSWADWAGALAWSGFGNLVGGVGLVTSIRLLRTPHRVAEERAGQS